MTNKIWNVLVTGGAGYVGSVLVPKLLAAGHRVTVLDLYLYGEDLFAPYRGNPNLIEVKGDLRDPVAVKRALTGCNAVIHLACISNDPSFELNPDLGKSINYDCFRPLVKASKDAGVKRFIYASSSSVYGIKNDTNVTEDLPLDPLTDYSKYKAMCEEVLDQEREVRHAPAVLDRQLGTRDRPHPEPLARMRELHRAPDAVVVGERDGAVAMHRRGGGELFRRGSAVEERIGRVGVELGVTHRALSSGLMCRETACHPPSRLTQTSVMSQTARTYSPRRSTPETPPPSMWPAISAPSRR